MDNQLAVVEKMGLSEGLTLEDCERDIELAGQLEELAHYVKGKRLGQIKRSGWYHRYGTWENYCHERWKVSQSHADLLIKESITIDNLKSASMELLPKTDRQTRPLINLEPDQQVTAWQEAVETAQNGGKAPGISVAQEIKISGRHVQETVDRLYPKESIVIESTKEELDLADGLPLCEGCHNCRHGITDSSDYNTIWCGKLERTISLSADYIYCDLESWESQETEIPLAVHFTSETPEWYTPMHIIDRVMKAMGDIDLDPCSDNAENPNVPAMSVFTEEDDGLKQDWFGRVYMNPPYGREIIDWVKKLIHEYEIGHVKEAIALAPSRTDTEWFRLLKAYPRCFIWGRLHFSGSENAAPFPSMLVYLGDNTSRFCEAFADIGDVYELR